MTQGTRSILKKEVCEISCNSVWDIFGKGKNIFHPRLKSSGMLAGTDAFKTQGTAMQLAHIIPQHWNRRRFNHQLLEYAIPRSLHGGGKELVGWAQFKELKQSLAKPTNRG